MTNQSINFLSQNRYKLSFSGHVDHLNNPFELMINSFTMPGLSSGVMDIPSPIRPIPMPGGSITYDELYVSFVVSENLSEWLYLFNWIKALNFGSSVQSEHKFSEAKLSLTTNKFNVNLGFTFQHCFPILLSPIDMDNQMTSNEVITSNASFRFADMILDG